MPSSLVIGVFCASIPTANNVHDQNLRLRIIVDAPGVRVRVLAVVQAILPDVWIEGSGNFADKVTPSMGFQSEQADSTKYTTGDRAVDSVIQTITRRDRADDFHQYLWHSRYKCMYCAWEGLRASFTWSDLEQFERNLRTKGEAGEIDSTPQ